MFIMDAADMDNMKVDHMQSYSYMRYTKMWKNHQKKSFESFIYSSMYLTKKNTIYKTVKKCIY